MSSATDLKDLPASARKVISRLEHRVTTLSEELEKLQQVLVRKDLFQAVSLGGRTGRLVLTPLDKREKAAVVQVLKELPSSVKMLEEAFKARRADKLAAVVPQGLTGAQLRGEAARVGWIRTGELVPAKTLADSWGLSPQALGPAADRGEVFSLTHKRLRYYPAEFLSLERDAVASVNKALEGLSEGEKLVFWKRPHGALGGKTVVQALSSTDKRALSRVLALAKAWAEQASADAAAHA
jgi:hypothetical protein